MTKDEALKLALEALEEPKDHFAKHRRLEAITAIKEALALPKQDRECKYCTHGCPACDARRQSNVLP